MSVRTPERAAIGEAASRREHQALYVPSVLDAAAETLTQVWNALRDGGVTGTDLYEASLAGIVLDAKVAALRRISAELTPEQVTPRELLAAVVSAASSELGRPLVPVDGPKRLRPDLAYVVLPRLPESPPLGPDGSSPLLLALASPGYGDRRGPWDWELRPSVKGGNTERRDIITPPPGPEAGVRIAGEVAAVVVAVLTGHMSGYGRSTLRR